MTWSKNGKQSARIRLAAMAIERHARTIAKDARTPEEAAEAAALAALAKKIRES
jgi:hypothetical protein